MPQEQGSTIRDGRMLGRMRAEGERARRAAGIAGKHEAMILTDRALSDLHARMADVHRRMERRHLVTALMYGSVLARHGADEKDGGASGREGGHGSALMQTTARLADSTGAVVAIFGSRPAERMALTSDATARRAHDLEYETGEGPGLDAVRAGQIVIASGRDLGRRWRLYGPGVRGLRVRSVAAVPLRLGASSFGALTLLNPRPDAVYGDALTQIGEALTCSLVDNYLDEEGALLDGGDHLNVVHQAAGALSVRLGCPVDDALALIRARAFAEDHPLESVARDILHDRRDLAGDPA